MNAAHTQWKPYEKAGLRFFFIYFIIQAVPLDWKFYKALFAIDRLDVSLFSLTKYSPQFFSLNGFENWGVAALLALAGAVIWGLTDKKERDYDTLLYWLRVILRYRLSIGIIAYGLIKFFPLQMPYPSLSNLHTNYGDFFAWKIYFHTIGITQGYEVFLGGVEILAGLLLLCRKTVTFGAGIIIGFTGNVVAANFAYDGGEQVYSAYLLVIALFLFAYDVPRLYSLLAKESYTIANKFKPVHQLKSLRLVVKTAFVLLIALLAVTTYAGYKNDPYKIPRTPGITGTYGFYNVREFRFNNTVIPYSTTDPNRWQNVVFEKWATVSIKIAKPLKLDLTTGDQYHPEDINRNFESAGVGGRRYFAYKADTVNHTFLLENKNRYHRNERFSLSYERLGDSSIIVKGVNEKNDSIYAVLDRITKKYMLFEGRRKPIKL